MRTAGFLMESFSDDGVIYHDHTAYQRIGVGVTEPAGGELKTALHVFIVRIHSGEYKGFAGSVISASR
jgi:hypothetical protein